VCWCRKPLPGLLALLVERDRLDPAACLYVADGDADRSFAGRFGLGYRTAEKFFARR
jgi:histidinol phosphatase-like enzyme